MATAAKGADARGRTWLPREFGHVSEQPNASPAGWHTAGVTPTADTCVALAQLHPIVGWLGSRELTETFRSVTESSAASRLPMRQPAPPQ